jgi:Domain of unknown function (DUF4388)
VTPPRHSSNSVLEGRLEDVPLADIIQVLQVGAKSGALLLSRDDGQSAILAFRTGAIIQAMCTQSYQSLGDRLISSEAITRIDLQGALDYMAQFPGMRLGDALVELGNVTRERIEDEVKAQMTETVEQLTSWKDAEFEFRIGFVALPRGMPEVAIDLVHEKGVEPRHLLLEASLLQDKRNRQRDLVNRPGEMPLEGVLEKSRKDRGAAGQTDADEEAEKIIRWFDAGVPLSPSDVEDPLAAKTAASYLSISEELFGASGRGEIGLLLLRYASELYSDGGLVLRTREGFRVLGQFGDAFTWGPSASREPKTLFATGESPLFDAIASGRRPYAGFVAVTPAGGLIPAASRTTGARVALAIPLFALGEVSLILFCRTALPGAPDARALIALARQVSVTLENAALREVAKRTASGQVD